MTLTKSLVICGVLASSTAHALTQQWGLPGDVPVPADFDGDGRADFVVWRANDGGRWFIKTSVTNVIRDDVRLGQPGDVPVPGDYDNDGLADFAIWRPSTGTWRVLRGANMQALGDQTIGGPGDIPVPADYDGDGRTDFAVWRPSTGMWTVVNSATRGVRTVQYGQAGDVPLPGEYDLVRGADFAVFRPSSGLWMSIGSMTFAAAMPLQWGGVGDVAVTPQLCSDQVTRTVWRNGTWLPFGRAPRALGVAGDRIVPADFIGDGADDLATWNPATGVWTVEEAICDHVWGATQQLATDATQQLRGITVAAIKNGNVRFATGAGWANDTTRASPTVPFQIASISKLFIATALLQQVDAGLVTFDRGAGIINPLNGGQPTVRHLATHTSGIRNGACYAIGNFEPSSSFWVDLFNCLVGPGAWILPPRAPGTFAEYSNAGAAWGARIVEQTSGMSFDLFTRNRIFVPLAMGSTAWFLSQLAGVQVSKGYNASFQPTNDSGVSPYPMGNLRSSALDLARFMIAWTNDGVGPGNVRILAPGRVASALQRLVPANADGGFFWGLWDVRDGGNRFVGRRVWAHGGVMPGNCTRLSIDPQTREGVVILTNGNCSLAGPWIDAIEERAYRTLATL